ncbi:MAG: M67 family metallopeptidase [Caldilineaceae bacterium]|nr:M67 family metallopeptidase [Caldilineaceae bacterium]
MARLQETPVYMPSSVRAAIIDHAREGKPEEICGIVRGRGLAAHEAIRGRNVASERIENYEVDPQTLLLQFKFEDAGDEMMGIYHSHPVSVAYPSATDAWNAYYPDCIYFICSLEVDEEPVIRAFKMQAHFIELALDEMRRSLPFYETRPGLFAYYRQAGEATPTPLAAIDAQVSSPYYIVYFVHPDGEIESRAVSLQEFRIEEPA